MRKKWSIIVTALFIMALGISLGLGVTVRKGETTVSPPTDLVGTKSGNGLSLTLSLNSTILQHGQEILVTIDEQNTLAVVNNVSASDNWPVKGLSLGPCGTLNYPVGVAIFQGYYTNVLSGTPLQLYEPGAYHCPLVLADIKAYAFQPLSDIASIVCSWLSSPCETESMTSQVAATGYWTDSQEATFSDFTPGVYTVVGGDEWGTLVVLHFVVEDNSKSR